MVMADKVSESAELTAQVRLVTNQVAVLQRLLRSFIVADAGEADPGSTSGALIATSAETRRALMRLEELLGALRPPGYQS
jgi:hypothetical protein